MEESCLDFFPDKGLFVLFYCPGPSKPWIHKCCQRGHVLDASLDPADCVPTPPGLGGPDWRPNNMVSYYFIYIYITDLKLQRGADSPFSWSAKVGGPRHTATPAGEFSNFKGAIGR